ncbi:hypothetical protein LTR08_003619 [Meristemomyces frigidus]|nr:hypothetical protein LTR08_003619 [Meristemomyces frigidus]
MVTKLSETEQKIQALEKQLEELVGESAANDALRTRLLNIAERTAEATRLPGEYLWRMVVRPHEYAVLRVALELDLPRLFHENSEWTTAQLAAKTGADEKLIVRLMRTLAAMNVFMETASHTYCSAPVSDFLAQDKQMADTVKFMWDVVGKAVFCLPAYLAQIQHQDLPSAPGAWRLAFGNGTDFFSYIAHDERLMDQFHNMMAVQRFRRPDWFDVYHVQENMVARYDASISNVMLVDIGGSRGHELQKFKTKFPCALGKLVLQDLGHVIEGADGLETSGIMKMQYDFFTPQPVKGAQVYYMRSILHDWDDDKCRAILSNIVSAMRKGYSRLIINDWVLPDTGARLYPCMQDINMMALFSAMERSESHFVSLVESVGLKVVRIWGSPEAERCIETMLPE